MRAPEPPRGGIGYRDFVHAGYRVFDIHPIRPDGSCDCGSPKCRAMGKHPVMDSYLDAPLWSDEQMDAFDELGWMQGGYGVVCGRGLLVVDVDPRNGGEAGYLQLIEDIPEVAGAGLVVATGGGGKHLYFRAPPDVAMVVEHHRYKGVDFKSSGYVVGPGSSHKSGLRYTVVLGSPEEIRDAPPALIEALRRPEYKRIETADGALDVSMGDVAAMVRAIPNLDDDYASYLAVGMALHDATGGADDGQALWDEWARKSTKYDPRDVDHRWHSFGRYTGPRVTAATLYKRASAAGWAAPVTFEYDGLAPATPVASPEEPSAPRPRHQVWLDTMLESRAERVARIAAQPWLIDGVVPAGGVASIVGGSGVGKSFVAIDMACAVASGAAWHGHATEPGDVVYVCAEGAGGIDKRVLAWAQAHDMNDVPGVRMVLDAPIIDDAKDATLVAQTIVALSKRTDAPVRLVVLDTLNRVMQGEENSATAMAALMRGVEAVRQRVGCAVLIIHHTGHGEQGRARGSSAFFAALDSEVTIKKIGATAVELENTKAKDSEPFAPVRLAFDKVALADIKDRQGRPVTSLVPRTMGMMEEGVALGEMTEDEQIIMQVVDEIGIARPRDDDLRAAFYDASGGAETPRATRDRYRRAIDGLIEKRYMKRDGKDGSKKSVFRVF